MVNRPLDPVAQKLAAVGEESSAAVVDWLASQHERQAMNRRATWCSIGGYSMMTFAAVASSLIAVVMSNEARKLIIDDLGMATVPLSAQVLPFGLVAVAALFLFGGGFAWVSGRIPGLRAIRSAIDWSTVGDAMTRLLSIGCTYPDAFRAAATVTKNRSNRDWLTDAAKRVEQGGNPITLSDYSRGDEAILELLVDAGEGEPSRQWKIASRHFTDVAQRRLVLLVAMVPVLSTIVSGILLWASISATLGWMWRATANLIQGMGF